MAYFYGEIEKYNEAWLRAELDRLEQFQPLHGVNLWKWQIVFTELKRRGIITEKQRGMKE